jgi:hypothetical protein
MADETLRLHQEIGAAKRLRENLASLFEDDPELARDSIEGETNLNEAIQEAVDLYCADKTRVEAIAEHIKLMETRKARLEKRMETTRSMICVALDQAGKKKVETALGTATLKNTPRQLQVHPEDEPFIPTKYWRTGKPSLDKKKLKADLEAGETIKGAQLDNGGQTVQITFK